LGLTTKCLKYADGRPSIFIVAFAENAIYYEFSFRFGTSLRYAGKDLQGFQEWLEYLRLMGEKELADDLAHTAASAEPSEAEKRYKRRS
jgi:hypothetical protein